MTRHITVDLTYEELQLLHLAILGWQASDSQDKIYVDDLEARLASILALDMFEED